jgi:hypothetical protein
MIKLLWPDYRMFAYERDLAVREVRSLVGIQPIEASGGLTVGSDDADLLRERVTYAQSLIWKEETVKTSQALTEEAHQRQRHIQARQATRFLVHGLHEYKGKFNPQLAPFSARAASSQVRGSQDPQR